MIEVARVWRCLPSQVIGEDPAVIATMIDILEEEQREQARHSG